MKYPKGYEQGMDQANADWNTCRGDMAKMRKLMKGLIGKSDGYIKGYKNAMGIISST